MKFLEQTAVLMIQKGLIKPVFNIKKKLFKNK